MEIEQNIKVHKPKFLKWALIVGIVIVLNLFFNYTISLFYKQPEYNTYFPQTQIVEPINIQEDCVKTGGQWTAYDWSDNTPGPKSANPQLRGYCDSNFTKQKVFEQAQKVYQRNVFIMLVILGIISFLVGAFVANEIIAIGFSWGGVLSFVIASVRYWSDADNWAKVLILAIALTALIWLAVKKFDKQ